ncbi:MAG: SpoIIIAC/SpoIIIAD family protein [Lachnospiraceae bacterium]
MSMIQVAIIGVIGTLIAIQFKDGRPEYGIYLTVGISILIFFSILDRLGIIVDALRDIGSYISLDNEYMGTMIKMLGITYVAEFSSGICKDAGYQSIAVQVEVFSKLAILALSMPILLALLQTIKSFLS